jgi:DNA-binding HxlR family transcriptional regulator
MVTRVTCSAFSKSRWVLAGGVPPRVDYGLTPLGKTLMGPIRLLTTWAADHGEAVLAAQESA